MKTIAINFSFFLQLYCYLFSAIVCNPIRDGKRRPIIGIVAQKVSAKYTPNVVKSDTYIAASYVKYLEMAGAQTIPLLPSYSEEKKKDLLSKINGVFFPGGAAPLDDSGYFKTAALAFTYAKEVNDRGTVYPIFGTCLGFETLHALTSQQDVLSKTDAENYSVPLNLTKDAYSSRMLRNMDVELLRAMMFENVAMHNHNMGVRTSVYGKNHAINSMFKVLSTNNDRKGREFVSTIEGIHYPFYGTQWHPEKSIFEWTIKENIDHTRHAIRIAQHIANFFVDEARNNTHRFDDFEEEKSMVMSKYSPVYSGRKFTFEQVYIFGQVSSPLIS